MAAATAIDTAWIVTLSDVAPDGTRTPVTAGWLRASLREVDERASQNRRPGAAAVRRRYRAIGDDVEYRIPLVPNARRFRRRPPDRTDPQQRRPEPGNPAIMNFRHASVGTSSINTVLVVEGWCCRSARERATARAHGGSNFSAGRPHGLRRGRG